MGSSSTIRVLFRWLGKCFTFNVVLKDKIKYLNDYGVIGDQLEISIWNHHKCVNWLFLYVIRIHMLCVYGSLWIFYFFSAGIDFRRQNLTSKIDSRAEKVNGNRGISWKYSLEYLSFILNPILAVLYFLQLFIKFIATSFMSIRI